MDAETTVPGVTVNEVAQGEGKARIFSVPSPRDMIGVSDSLLNDVFGALAIGRGSFWG
jgi:hypothetical protein